MRHRKSRDGNEPEICKALEAIPGGRVTATPIEGAGTFKGRLPRAGVPDLLVGVSGIDGREPRTHLLEVKNMATKGSYPSGKQYVREDERGVFARVALSWLARGRQWVAMGPEWWPKVRRGQLEWAAEWTGSPMRFVSSPEEAAAAIGVCLRCGDDDSGGLCPPCELDGVT